MYHVIQININLMNVDKYTIFLIKKKYLNHLYLIKYKKDLFLLEIEIELKIILMLKQIVIFLKKLHKW